MISIHAAVIQVKISWSVLAKYWSSHITLDEKPLKFKIKTWIPTDQRYWNITKLRIWLKCGSSCYFCPFYWCLQLNQSSIMATSSPLQKTYSNLKFLNSLTSLGSDVQYNPSPHLPSYWKWTISSLWGAMTALLILCSCTSHFYKGERMYREQKEYSVFTWCF